MKLFTTLYITFVHPHLEYCVSIWNPHLARDVNTLEKLQRATNIYLHTTLRVTSR